MKLRSAAAAAALAVVAGGLAAGPAMAATTEVVSETDATRAPENAPPTDEWMLYTRLGTPPTAGTFVTGPETPPLGLGSFQMSTLLGTEKVFLFNYEHVGTRLADVDDISYSTYRQEGQFQQAPALNLQVDHNGPAVAGGFTTLVFEPVYNTDQGSVVDDEWQDWDADGSGIWWSTRPIPGTNCAGAMAACDQTWDEIVANNPDATILGGVGVNQGSGNPGLVANVDAFTFDDVTYDFEPDSDGDGLPDGEDTNSKDDCKDGGYTRFVNPTFKNQGECVSYFAKQK